MGDGWITSMVGAQYAPWVMFVLVALAIIITLIIIRSLWRGMRGGVFVAHGRERKRRLAVVDATAIDNRRRLVLVRRDDTEHLILIGGHNDVLVETGIVPGSKDEKLPATQPKRPSVAERPAPLPQAPRAAEPRQQHPAPVEQAQPETTIPPAHTIDEPEPPRPQKAFRHVAPAVATAAAATTARAEPGFATALVEPKSHVAPDGELMRPLEQPAPMMAEPEPQLTVSPADPIIERAEAPPVNLGSGPSWESATVSSGSEANAVKSEPADPVVEVPEPEQFPDALQFHDELHDDLATENLESEMERLLDELENKK